jgi:hypothetical protein
MVTDLKVFIQRVKLAFKLASTPSPQISTFAQEMLDLEKLDDVDRYHASFMLLSKLAGRWNFQVYNRNLCWVDDPEFWEVWRSSPFYNIQRPDRKFAAWSMALSTLGIDGDTAECGVLDGATSYLICSAAKSRNVQKIHHAFDSWEGLSDTSVEDQSENKYNVFYWKKGDLSVLQEDAMRNLAAFDSIKYYKGWIPDRFNEVKIKKFSFVHIDVDIYQPTKDSLEFFYTRMNPGGVILCDDYGYHTCPGAQKAFDDFMSDKIEGPVIHIPTGQGFIVKR